MDNIMLALIALLALPVILALLAFTFVFREYLLDRRARRHNLLYRFNPDLNGNYPIYFDLSQARFLPRPGNPGVPGNYEVIVQPPNKHYYHDTPILVNPPRQASISELPARSRSFIEAVTSEISEISPDIRQNLTRAKQEGIGKTEALRQAGFKPGKGKDYQFWSREWENL